MMRRRLHGEQSGAAVLELALVLPVVLGVVGLILFGGWLGVVKTILDHGAREGARHAAIPSSADLRSYPTQAEVAAAVEDATPWLSPTGVSVTSGAGGAARFAPVKVVVTFDVANPFYALFAPLRAFGWGEDVSPTLTISSEAEVRRE
ncbi:MAG: TadE/TadG family type IV pilus assembly protein [Actinomycetota bacterium]